MVCVEIDQITIDVEIECLDNKICLRTHLGKNNLWTYLDS